jgi:hypothetical protein
MRDPAIPGGNDPGCKKRVLLIPPGAQYVKVGRTRLRVVKPPSQRIFRHVGHFGAL